MQCLAGIHFNPVIENPGYCLPDLEAKDSVPNETNSKKDIQPLEIEVNHCSESENDGVAQYDGSNGLDNDNEHKVLCSHVPLHLT